MDIWKEVRLERESPIATTRQAAEETKATPGDTAVRIADLAAKGSLVATAAADDLDHVWLLYHVSNFADLRMKVQDIDQVLLHEIIFLSVYLEAV